MSCKSINSSARVNLYPKQHQPTKFSSIGSCSSLSFGAKSTKNPSFSIKTAPVSYGNITACRASCGVAADFYAETTVESTTFYDLLGISESVTFSEIKKAYKVLARKYHPDVSPPDCIEEHTRRFIMVKEAYETLSDPHSRALYDREMDGGSELGFSDRKRSENQTAEWKCRWQSQLNELKRRSMNKNCRGKSTSCAARMRRQRDG